MKNKYLDKLTPLERDFWLEFVNRASIDISEVVKVEASPAGNFDITDDLIGLYKLGKKHAGSSIIEDFESAGDPLPAVGDLWILLNSKKIPVMILKTIKTEIHKFKDVPERIAIAEGEGDLSLEYWRKTHSDLYSPYLKEWGVEDLSDASVITEFFEIVYRS